MPSVSDLVFRTLVVPPDGVPPYYPEVVAAFEAEGFRRVGGLLADLTDERVEEIAGWYDPPVQSEMRRSARTPETILAAPDASAFVGVDWFFDMPSVRLRTLLADGRLVETQRAWDRLPVQVRERAPYVARLRLRPEQDRSARGRLVTMVEDADPAQLWSAHQEAIARSDGTPVPHRTAAQAQARGGRASSTTRGSSSGSAPPARLPSTGSWWSGSCLSLCSCWSASPGGPRSPALPPPLSHWCSTTG